ncbi:Knottin [Corchorus capsularis]|uniref:Knottin n=1 Tax=Corchorus capsularis TaxID=210143 RepID=A0A1R3HVE9_COCAP|nr:Knottin [Corchorus capsularis]
MAKFVSVALLLALFILVASFDEGMVPMAEAKLCSKRSKTWSGFCNSSANCNRQCREWEDAKHGACHFEFPGFACFCYFDC